MLVSVLQTLLVYVLVCISVQKNGHHLALLQKCPRPQSSMVRQLLHKLWGPIFKRHRVKMHRDCPFHIARDVFGFQEAAKQFYRNDLWVCAICGKPFVAHVFLDMHMYNAHNNVIYSGDDAVCLADYCDIFRCQAYLPPSSSEDDDNGHDNPIIDLATHRSLYPNLGVLKPHAVNSASSGEVALAPAPPPELLHMLNILGSQKTAIDQLDELRLRRNSDKGDKDMGGDYGETFLGTRPRRGQDEATTTNQEGATTTGATRKDTRPREEGRMSSLESMLWSVLGKVKEKASAKIKGGAGGKQKDRLKIVERWRQPAGQEECDRENVAKVREKCEALVDGCISYHAGESDQLYEKLKGDLYRSTCDYLDCDKYWYLLTSEGDGDADFDPPQEAQKGEIPVRLFVATLVGLLVFLALFYHLVWLCLARIVDCDEERAGEVNIRARGFIYNGYRNG